MSFQESEVASAEEQNKPVEESIAPDTGTSEAVQEFFSEDFNPEQLPRDLREQYRLMRADYTQKTQSIAEKQRTYEEGQAQLERLRNDPEAQREFFGELGYEFAEEEPEFEPYEEEPDEPVFHDARLDEFLEVIQTDLQRQEQEAAAEAYRQKFAEGVTEYAKTLGRELLPQELDYLVKHVSQTDSDEPDVQAAAKALDEFREATRLAHADSKSAPEVQRGTPGSPITNDREESYQRALRIVEEGQKR